MPKIVDKLGDTLIPGWILRSTQLGILTASLAFPGVARAETCQYLLGFKALHDLAPGRIGACRTNEYHQANGDGAQQTEGGTMYWRKADNWTAYTDGYRTFINGPYGLEIRLNTQRFPWEHDADGDPTLSRITDKQSMSMLPNLPFLTNIAAEVSGTPIAPAPPVSLTPPIVSVGNTTAIPVDVLQPIANSNVDSISINGFVDNNAMRGVVKKSMSYDKRSYSPEDFSRLTSNDNFIKGAGPYTNDLSRVFVLGSPEGALALTRYIGRWIGDPNVAGHWYPDFHYELNQSLISLDFYHGDTAQLEANDVLDPSKENRSLEIYMNCIKVGIPEPYRTFITERGAYMTAAIVAEGLNRVNPSVFSADYASRLFSYNFNQATKDPSQS